MCWGMGAWCRGVGVVEGYCCFCVVERFLEGRSEFEFVVEFVGTFIIDVITPIPDPAIAIEHVMHHALITPVRCGSRVVGRRDHARLKRHFNAKPGAMAGTRAAARARARGGAERSPPCGPARRIAWNTRGVRNAHDARPGLSRVPRTVPA